MAKKNILGSFKPKLDKKEERPLDALLSRRKNTEPVKEKELEQPKQQKIYEAPAPVEREAEEWVKDTFFVRADFLKKLKTLAATTPGATKKEILDQILEDYFSRNKVKDLGEIRVKKGRPVNL